MTAPDSPAVEPTPPPIDPSEQLELKLPDESSAWRDLGLWAGVLVLLTLVVYWPATGGRFQWLDDRAVSHDRLLAMPGGLSAVWAGRWGEHAAGYPFAAYQPVAFTADWIAYRLGGHDDAGRPTPTAYHAVALIGHAGAAVLAWLVLRELAVSAAWLVAAVFTVHPVNAQAVSWINDGGATVGGLLFFASAYAYLSYLKFRDRDVAAKLAGGEAGDPAQTWGVYAAAVVLAIGAELAFPAAGAVPAAVMLALWWRRRLTRLDVLLLAPVLAVTAILWLTNLSLTRPAVPGGVPPVVGLPALGEVAAVGSGLQFALLKSVLPVPLKLIYSTTLLAGLLGLLVAAVILGVLPAARGRRGPIAAAATFAVVVVPALNWFDPLRRGVLSDSAAYLGVVPVAAVVLAAAAAGLRRARTGEAHTQAAVAASAALLLVLGATAWARGHVFETPVGLWTDTSAKAPRSAFAATALAESYRLRAAEDAANQDADQTKADLDAAVVEAGRAASLAATTGDGASAAAAQRTWAEALVSDLDATAALPHFAASTAITADAPTLVQYAQALLSLGHRAPEAIAVLNRALAADPGSATAHRVLGQAYRDAGNDRRFLVEEQAAVNIDPSDLLAEQDYAEALAQVGRLKESSDRYLGLLAADKANQFRPDLWAALGRVEVRQGTYDRAVAELVNAQKLDPKLAGLDADLADARAKLRRAAATRPALTRPASQPADPMASPPGGATGTP